ncbi:hypothetical protein E2C01_004639 [Portunus trituberculatus]|uniref:Uncharacterized protein n=1 Tax=Portunus trituberculatus TaxID=210409 RepID=A0A5B7CWY8_PORTR|nr:hypothetical protein [Portunus trituberculatus]
MMQQPRDDPQANIETLKDVPLWGTAAGTCFFSWRLELQVSTPVPRPRFPSETQVVIPAAPSAMTHPPLMDLSLEGRPLRLLLPRSRRFLEDAG